MTRGWRDVRPAPKPDSAQSYGDIHWALLVGVHHQRDSYDARFERIERHGKAPRSKEKRDRP